MERELGQIKFTEIDDGFRIEVTGKSLKDMCNCGCGPVGLGAAWAAACCQPAAEPKKEK
ncbi:MAG TPA: hypothetical protein VN285_03210 [Candidatus Deferrimicrobium sp.]|nr:hypothetical protein [Candidatus Deferrimicrobium sp.]